jgi:hypothetical protein
MIVVGAAECVYGNAGEHLGVGAGVCKHHQCAVRDVQLSAGLCDLVHLVLHRATCGDWGAAGDQGAGLVLVGHGAHDAGAVGPDREQRPQRVRGVLQGECADAVSVGQPAPSKSDCNTTVLRSGASTSANVNGLARGSASWSLHVVRTPVRVFSTVAHCSPCQSCHPLHTYARHVKWLTCSLPCATTVARPMWQSPPSDAVVRPDAVTTWPTQSVQLTRLGSRPAKHSPLRCRPRRSRALAKADAAAHSLHSDLGREAASLRSAVVPRRLARL